MSNRNPVLQSIAERPWSSAQDALLGASVLAVALLLAIEYELFRFAGDMTDRERRITVLEAVLLTALLGCCIGTFIYRRTQEHRLALIERSQVESHISQLRDEAMRDPLTGLPNRRAVMTRLAGLDARATGRSHALLMLDLNEFKRVNDQYGHRAGDSVLQIVAERFLRVSRPTDLLARLGGDEFAVLVYDVDRNGAMAAGVRFLAVLKNEVSVEGVRHDVGVSIGAVMIPEHGEEVDDILAKADIAMYRAKTERKSALVFYSESMADKRPAMDVLRK